MMPDISAVSAATDPTLLATRLTPPSGLSLKMGAGASDAKIEKTAQDFEAMFATEMLRPMFEGIDVDSTFGGGHGEEAMRSFLLQEYGKAIAKTDKLGIASKVKAEMIRLQGDHKDETREPNVTGLRAYRAYQNASARRDNTYASAH